jgi:ElaB/YqjD/DUF883 family membrane-anchored ribosome-binding protein
MKNATERVVRRKNDKRTTTHEQQVLPQEIEPQTSTKGTEEDVPTKTEVIQRLNERIESRQDRVKELLQVIGLDADKQLERIKTQISNAITTRRKSSGKKAQIYDELILTDQAYITVSQTLIEIGKRRVQTLQHQEKFMTYPNSMTYCDHITGLRVRGKMLSFREFIWLRNLVLSTDPALKATAKLELNTNSRIRMEIHVNRVALFIKELSESGLSMDEKYSFIFRLDPIGHYYPDHRTGFCLYCNTKINVTPANGIPLNHLCSLTEWCGDHIPTGERFAPYAEVEAKRASLIKLSIARKIWSGDDSNFIPDYGIDDGADHITNDDESESDGRQADGMN